MQITSIWMKAKKNPDHKYNKQASTKVCASHTQSSIITAPSLLLFHSLIHSFPDIKAREHNMLQTVRSVNNAITIPQYPQTGLV